MTQYYYTKKILPHYLDELDNMRAKFGCGTLQEDGDLSHDTKSTWYYAWRVKRSRDVLRHLLTHPSQSPDLNPQEAMWNILKQRVRHYTWTSQKQLMDIMRQEWWAIPQWEIQRRFDEMPDRCKRVAKNGGKAIKTDLW